MQCVHHSGEGRSESARSAKCTVEADIWTTERSYNQWQRSPAGNCRHAATLPPCRLDRWEGEGKVGFGPGAALWLLSHSAQTATCRCESELDAGPSPMWPKLRPQVQVRPELDLGEEPRTMSDAKLGTCSSESEFGPNSDPRAESGPSKIAAHGAAPRCETRTWGSRVRGCQDLKKSHLGSEQRGRGPSGAC